MPPPLSIEQKDRISKALREGKRPESIGKAEGVSDRVVRKIRTNWKTWGSHTAPALTQRGRPRLVTAAMEAGLRAFLEEKPWAYQDEIVEYLFDRWGVLVGRSTVSHTLQRMNINRPEVHEFQV